MSTPLQAQVRFNRMNQKKDAAGRRYWGNALTGKGTRKGQSGLPWHGYNPTAVGRHWAVPGKIAEELGLDPELSTQEKLDALDAAGFVTHPSKGSEAMPTYVQYLDRSPGMPLQDLWTYQPHTRGVLHDSDEGIDEDVRWLAAQGDPERLGYETQKPVGLLRRIILSSCPENGIVLDPFCGCGSTIDAAQRLGRRWLGIDVTYLAVGLIQRRLEGVHDLKAKKDYRIEGEPEDENEARALAEYDRCQFQWWVVFKLGGRLDEKKKGADRGIDGRLYFHDESDRGVTKVVILSVKSGHVSVKDVRDLNDVVRREGAAIGVLVTLEPSSQPMRSEAGEAGLYKSPWRRKPFQKTQILTIADLFAGKEIDMPPLTQTNVTFRKAKRSKPAKGLKPKAMFDEEE